MDTLQYKGTVTLTYYNKYRSLVTRRTLHNQGTTQFFEFLCKLLATESTQGLSFPGALSIGVGTINEGTFVSDTFKPIQRVSVRLNTAGESLTGENVVSVSYNFYLNYSAIIPSKLSNQEYELAEKTILLRPIGVTNTADILSTTYAQLELPSDLEPLQPEDYINILWELSFQNAPNNSSSTSN